jgi:hypothetical protein
MVDIRIDHGRTFLGKSNAKTNTDRRVSGTDKERYLQVAGINLLHGAFDAFSELPREADLTLEIGDGRSSLSGTVTSPSVAIRITIEEVVETIHRSAQQFAKVYPDASASIRMQQEILE